MSEETKLLPCPFCGSTNIDSEGWMSCEPDGSDKKTGPACDDCAGSTESVERWNTRAAPSSPVVGREGMVLAALHKANLYPWGMLSDGATPSPNILAFVDALLALPPEKAPAPGAVVAWPNDTDLAAWAKNWHWADCKAGNTEKDPTIYPRDLRLLKAFLAATPPSPPPAGESRCDAQNDGLRQALNLPWSFDEGNGASFEEKEMLPCIADANGSVLMQIYFDPYEKPRVEEKIAAMKAVVSAINSRALSAAKPAKDNPNG